MTFVGQHASYKGRNLRTMPNVPDGENVTYIDLSDNPISSFNQFLSYPNLRFLCVDNTKIVSFHYAPELPMLEEFTCRGTSLSCLQYLHLMSVMVFGDRMQFVNGVKVEQRTWMLGKAARKEYRKHLIDGFVFLKIDPVKMINNETRQRKSIFNDLSKLLPKENVQPITRSSSHNFPTRTRSLNFVQKEKTDQQRPSAPGKVLRTVSSPTEDVLVSYANARQSVNDTERRLKSQFNLMSNRILASAVDQRSIAMQQNAIIEAHNRRRKHRSNGNSNSNNNSSQQNQEQEKNDNNANNSNKRKKRSSASKQDDEHNHKYNSIQNPTKHNSSYDLKSLSKNENISKAPKSSKPPLPPSNQTRKQNRNSLNPMMIYPPSNSLDLSSSSSSSSSSPDETQNAAPQSNHKRRSTSKPTDQSNSIQANRHSESMPDLAQYHRTHRHRRGQEENEHEQEEQDEQDFQDEQFEFEPSPNQEKQRHRPRQQQQDQQQQQQQQVQNQQQEEPLIEQLRHRQRQHHQTQQDPAPDADFEKQRHRMRRTQNDDQENVEQNKNTQDHHIRRRSSQQIQVEKLNENGIRKQRSSDHFVPQRPIPIPHQTHQHHHNEEQITQPQPEPQMPQIEQIQQPEAPEQPITTENNNNVDDQIVPQFIEEEEEVETNIQNEEQVQPSSNDNNEITIEQPEIVITTNVQQEQNENENLNVQVEEEEENEKIDQIQTQSQSVIQSDNQPDNSNETKLEEEQKEEPQPSSSEFSSFGQNSQIQQDEDKDKQKVFPSSLPPSPTQQDQPQQQLQRRKSVKINIPHDLSAISENSPIFLSVNSDDSDAGDILNNLLSEDSGAPARNDNPNNIVLELLPEDLSSDDTSRKRRNFVVAPFPTNDDS